MKYKKNQPKIDEMVDYLMKELKPLGIYIANRSVTTASIYLKFKDERLRSLTVRDHKTKAKYRYKWNVILGYKGPAKVTDRNITRYMYNEHQLHKIVGHIFNYEKKIDENVKW